MYDTSKKYEFALLTEQAHTVILEHSRSSGTFQLMIARRFTNNGSVILDDKATHTQKLWLGLGLTNTITRLRHSLIPKIQFPFHYSGGLVTTVNQWNLQYRTLFNPISMDLPVNIHLFSFTPIRNLTDNTIRIILRLQHLYEANEDDTYSKPVTINLSQLFSVIPYKITSLIEKNLLFSLNKSITNRWNWNSSSIFFSKVNSNEKSQDFIVTINPLEIRTYEIIF